MLDSEDNIKLIDFGMSTDLKCNYLNKNTYLGTAFYPPPEYFFNATHDYSSDIWAAGLFFFEILFKEFPYEFEENVEEIDYL
jgi:serine/threonine protein kinase